MTSLPLIDISPRAAQQIAEGRLWVFSNEIKMPAAPVTAGTWCCFKNNDRVVATGYFNSHSLIAGRVVSQDKREDISPLLQEQLEKAFKRRGSFEENGARRLFFSEADFLPGLIVDWYAGVVVIQSNTAGIDAVLNLLEQQIPETIKKVFGSSAKGLVIRADTSIRQLEGLAPFSKVVFGNTDEMAEHYFFQGKLFYAADFFKGQKTGFFLDQAENRPFLLKALESAPGGTVLDLFCYSGGWGLTALKGGASRITFVDESQDALDLVKKSLERNGFPSTKAELVKADVFDFLASHDKTYDTVIADPPAFVKSKKNIPQALRAYQKLNRQSWRRLNKGGVLISSSCSYHVSEPEFIEALREAVAKESGLAHLVFRGTQASDHPILLSMPETQYLKCVGLKKLK